MKTENREKRADVKTGFLCNNNCRFCVQAWKKHLGNRSTEDIKKDMVSARKTCSGVVLTGGEPTIRKDIFELVSYARDIGFKTIQIQTNGRMFAYDNFCRRMVEAGATEFAPALHGHTAELHDYLTRNRGSFRQTVKGIKNLRELGKLVMTNTVVVKPNYRYLSQIANLLLRLHVNQFQFAFVHPMGNAWENYDSMVPDISLAAPHIRRGLRMGNDAGVTVMAEAMPYCLMRGFEKHVSERFIPKTEIRDINKDHAEDWDERRLEGKAKFPQCKGCRYDDVCEGPWREYPEKKGHKEFVPVKQENPAGRRSDD